MTRTEFLREIASQHSEIIGACFYVATGDIVQRGLSAILQEEEIQRLGDHLLKMQRLGQQNGLDVDCSYFQFDKYTVITMPVAHLEAHVLIILCEPYVNHSLVGTTVALLAVDLEEGQRRTGTSRSLFSRKSSRKKKKPAAGDSLQPLLAAIEQALAAEVGPIAPIITQDHAQRWTQKGPLQRNRLPELIELLAKEIGNPAKAKDFRLRVNHLF